LPACLRLTLAYRSSMIDVESLSSSIRVTIPRGEVDPGQLEELLGWLRIASAARRSTLDEADANAMAEAAKADWWARNKARFLPEAQP